MSETKTDSFRTTLTFILAIVVIGAFLLYYGLVLGFYLYSQPSSDSPTSSFEGLEKVTATLGPIVAAIIGYYFGQRPIQEISGQRDMFKAQAFDLLSKTDIDRNLYEKLNSIIETNKRVLGGMLDLHVLLYK